MKASHFSIQVLLILNLLLIAGCSPEVALSPSPIAQSVQIVPTVTHTAASTLAPTALSTPTPALTITPVATTIAGIQPTITGNSTPDVNPTAIPTLSSEQVAGAIQELFEDNGDCLLPCFWGITPGETEWQTAQEFLEPLALQISTDAISAEVRLPAPDNNSNTAELRQFYVLEDGIITWIISPLIQTSAFQPSTILNNFGTPDEIWLLTANAPREGYWRSMMTLFYPRYGFILQYGGNNTQQDGIIRGCGFEQTELILLGSWSMQEEINYEEISTRRVLLRETTYDLPLQEATGISVEAFYETFKDPDNPICLETPLDLWPGP